jgi:hypothetical protein
MPSLSKEELIKLTGELYGLTRLFPKKEPLRSRLRALADDVLADFVRFNAKGTTELIKSIEAIESLLAVAKEQNWVKSGEILKLAEDYANLKRTWEDIGSQTLEQPILNFGLDFARQSKNEQRHQQILEIVKEKGKIQVWELKKLFPELSKRTLRRDFEHLLSLGLVQRIGDKSQTYYMYRTEDRTKTEAMS